MSHVSDLQAVKARFGGLVRLDYSRYDLPTAHRLLGGHSRQQVLKILSHKLDTWEPGRIRKLLTQSQACAALLAEKVHDRHLDGRLRAAVSEYLECLSAWADGAGLVHFEHPALAAFGPQGQSNLAMFLQNDGTGCQTGMYREQDGSVVLWHTEEDVEDEPGSGFDLLRIVEFNVGDETHPVIMRAFIYPDLLPGPAFGWRTDGFSQAVDKLHIRDFPNMTHGILANVVTWLTLRLGPAMEIREVIESLQPFYDGYGLSTVDVQDGAVQARKNEFAADRIFTSRLDERAESFLFQVNILTDRSHPWVLELEDLRPDWCGLYEQRLSRTVHAMRNKDGKSGEADSMRFLFNLITSQVGDRWAYANPDVKAYFIHRQSLQGAETWLGDGPAMPDDSFSIHKTQLD